MMTGKNWSTICAMIGVFLFALWRVYHRRIKWWFAHRNQMDWYFEPTVFSRENYRAQLKERWRKHKISVAKRARAQYQQMAQINGTLVAPIRLYAQTCFVEVMGHLVTLYTQNKPSLSMYIHPQDTILEIMQKFKVPLDHVLVYDSLPMDDLDKVLLEYGVPDNRKVHLCARPRTMRLGSVEIKEIFQNL